MKQTLFIWLVVASILALVGCSAVQSTTGTDSGAPPASGTAIPGQGDFQIPQILKLALGTVKLDESAYPIDAKQAAELLPLWKAYRSLSKSDTTAAQELEGLTRQIQGSLSADQVLAIEDMNLSMRDMGTVAQSLGIESGIGGPGQFGAMDETQREAFRATAQASGGAMGPLGGGFPMDSGGPGGGFDPQARQTAMAERGASGGAPSGGFGLNSAFLDALIKFLEAKTQQ
jgi:hypothetical protein